LTFSAIGGVIVEQFAAGRAEDDRMHSTPKRKMTTPGLGETGKREKVTIREDEAVPASRQNIVCPEPLVPDSLASKETIRTATTTSKPPQSGTAKKQQQASGTPRPSPVRVDQVGGYAMKIASRGRPSSVPRLAKSKLDAAKAPLDSQSAYVLSLIDGTTTLEGLADITGIPADRVTQIIERLERLGFVAQH
jgi:hypothetical protein